MGAWDATPRAPIVPEVEDPPRSPLWDNHVRAPTGDPPDPHRHRHRGTTGPQGIEAGGLAGGGGPPPLGLRPRAGLGLRQGPSEWGRCPATPAHRIGGRRPMCRGGGGGGGGGGDRGRVLPYATPAPHPMALPQRSLAPPPLPGRCFLPDHRREGSSPHVPPLVTPFPPRVPTPFSLPPAPVCDIPSGC